MARISLLLITLASILVHNISSLDAKFAITKHYVEDKSKNSLVSIGKLIIFEEGEVNQAYIEPEYPEFITSKDISSTQAVILTFTQISTGKTFTTAVTSSKKTPHSEKIMIVISGRQQIIGFNYVQTRIPNQQISTDFLTPDRAIEHVLKAEPVNKPGAVEQQSFFQKYKWPLIIGGVILYLSMMADPEKAAGQGQGGPARQ